MVFDSLFPSPLIKVCVLLPTFLGTLRSTVISRFKEAFYLFHCLHISLRGLFKNVLMTIDEDSPQGQKGGNTESTIWSSWKKSIKMFPPSRVEKNKKGELIGNENDYFWRVTPFFLLHCLLIHSIFCFTILLSSRAFSQNIYYSFVTTNLF